MEVIVNKTQARTPLTLPCTSLCTGELNAIQKQKCFLCSPFYGRACRWVMLGEIKTYRDSRTRKPGNVKPWKLGSSKS